MKKIENFSTEQETFWAGSFGSEYISRNQGDLLLASNLKFFSDALSGTEEVASCLEFGANIGMNLRAIRLLYPKALLNGIEINPDAAKILSEFVGESNVYHGSIFDYPVTAQFDLSLIKGVLIHINPDMLSKVYQKLYEASKRYILVCEYYNPSPVTINYRGHTDRLFKRDFAGEMLDLYPDLKLIDYGFAYRRDPSFPQDDITWFLMEKKG
ncbi:MAG TPA: pseudaminic acid biosynthesis-associated methylase [Methylophilus sp.]|nr:pseudaminic acid biosynthesis-associated methylase [Methylophilus sp.]HQQ33328.1 pseudaminic acid biosynthesis-associated methylase [Methylophilus sp.]